MGWLLHRLLDDKRYLLHVGYCACVGRGTVLIEDDLNGRGAPRRVLYDTFRTLALLSNWLFANNCD